LAVIKPMQAAILIDEDSATLLSTLPRYVEGFNLLPMGEAIATLNFHAYHLQPDQTHHRSPPRIRFEGSE
jgi:hypothetical protein